MMKLHDLSTEKAAQAVALRNEGVTQTAIALRLGVHQPTIQRCLKRHQELGTFNTRRSDCGRHRVTTARTDTLIRRIAVANPNASSSYIATQLPADVRIANRTIRHRLQHDFGLKAYRPAPKPRFSAKNIKDRLAFCRRYKHWTAAEWRKVLFSDETSIRQYSNYTTHVRRPPGKRYSSQYTVPKVKQSPTVMIWGCIAASGRGGLWIMPPNSTIKAITYKDILAEKLPAFMPRLNCWVILKKKVAKLNPTSYKDLVDKVKLVWVQQITKEYCNGLVESMPRRIHAVLAAKGGCTKY